MVKGLFTLSAIILQTGSVLASNPQVESINFRAGGLSIAVHGCSVRAAGSTLVLPLDAPCSVARDGKGQPRVVPFRSAQVFMMEGAPTRDAVTGRDCRTRLLPVVVVDGRLHLGHDPMLVATCPPQSWDSKMFTAAAEIVLDRQKGRR